MQNPQKLLYFVVAGVATFFLIIVGLLTATRSFQQNRTTNENFSEEQQTPIETPAGKQAATAVAPGCKLAGCNAELCMNEADEDMASICIAHPKYACYQTAQCAKQADGNCGWNQTDELTACLNKDYSSEGEIEVAL